MLKLSTGVYDREAAVAYAHKWALGRNPEYYNFDQLGGDCTNFASQCLYAGSGVMNFTPTYGWFYVRLNKRAPSWTSVRYLYEFLTGNTGEGPYGREIDIGEVRPGDLVQLIIDQESYQHTPVITSVGIRPDVNNIMIAAHSYDCDNRPLSSYDFKSIRFIHIDGFRYAGRP